MPAMFQQRLAGMTIPPPTNDGAPTIEPDAGVWARWLCEARIDERARTMRSQLGLATDTPIVMTGHQPIAFHAGILAKYAAAQAAGRAFGAQVAHLVADQDVVDPLVVRRAVLEADGTLRDEPVSLRAIRGGDAPALTRAEVPVAMRPAVRVEERADEFARFARALNERSDARSLGEQSARAVADLLEPRIERAPMVFATRLRETDLFNELVDRMRDDPGACARAYNEALVAVGHTHTRPLAIDGSRVELPLWRVREGEARKSVFSDEIGSIPRDELAPTALTMTGLMRTGACDVFIHGTGGAAYDKATEVWFERWLGWALCPAACVTATRLLDLGVPITTEVDVARAVWWAHHARHEPGMLGDDDAAGRKRELVAAIGAARERGEDAAGLFAQLHTLLRDVRTRHADVLMHLEIEANEARQNEAQSRLARDRSWSFLLHSEETVSGLVREIDAVFAPVVCDRIGCR